MLFFFSFFLHLRSDCCTGTPSSIGDNGFMCAFAMCQQIFFLFRFKLWIWIVFVLLYLRAILHHFPLQLRTFLSIFSSFLLRFDARIVAMSVINLDLIDFLFLFVKPSSVGEQFSIKLAEIG